MDLASAPIPEDARDQRQGQLRGAHGARLLSNASARDPVRRAPAQDDEEPLVLPVRSRLLS